MLANRRQNALKMLGKDAARAGKSQLKSRAKYFNVLENAVR
jgi:hypothetical protein